MTQQKLNRARWMLSGAIIFLLGLGLMLSIGTTYSRYNVTKNGFLQFKAREASRFYLFSSRTSDGVGQIANMDWNSENGKRTLGLCVSNSDENGNSPSTKDIAVRIRLFVPEGQADSSLSDPNGNLKLSLKNDQNENVYGSESIYLSTNTPMYKSKEQKGWIYCFLSKDGEAEEECLWILPGGKASDLTVTIILENETISTEGFILYVDRVGVYR